MKLETGLHQGCIGDYDKAKAAQDALEDAKTRAAIDLGVGATLFAGATAASNFMELRKLAAAAKQIEGTAPEWASAIDHAAVLAQQSQQLEHSAVAAKYELAEIPGLTGTHGTLTIEGQRTANAISELEDMGFSQQSIHNALRSCTK